jgi:hypothetical protein
MTDQIVRVAHIQLGDVDEPDLFAQLWIDSYQYDKKGSWVIAHSTEELKYMLAPDFATFGLKLSVYARFTPADLLLYKIKFSEENV